MGPRLEAEIAMLRWPIGEFGIRGSAYRSAIAFSPDAQNGSATDFKGLGFLQFKANTNVLGVPMLRVLAGYHYNVRNLDRGMSAQGAKSAPHFAGELATLVDGTFTVGLNGGYTFSEKGVTEAGGFISQRIYTGKRNWDAKLGVSAASAKETGAGGRTLTESWNTFQLGLVGSI